MYTNTVPIDEPAQLSEFNMLLNQYRISLQIFDRPKAKFKPEEILNLLTCRDQIQVHMTERSLLSSQQLLRLADLDCYLKKYEVLIATHLDLEAWQQLVHPPRTSWWWFLRAPEPRHWWNEYDWLFNAGTLVVLTISASLITDTATRLFSGGIDLGSTLVISGQSLLALLAGGGALTQAGRQAYERLLSRLRINKHYWQEASFTFALLLVLSLAGIHSALPGFAEMANQNGEAHYQNGKLDSARKDFSRAIALKQDFPKAHFNLALVHEDLQQLEDAKAQYQLVVTQKDLVNCNAANADHCDDLMIWLQAHNNLAELDIVDEEYGKAAPLLQAGLRKLEQQGNEVTPKSKQLKYNLLKNLGWARLNQTFFSEAENYLKQAARMEPKAPDSFCMLAKLSEAKNEKQKALPDWKKCLIKAQKNPIVLETQPEVNQWVAEAQERLSATRDAKQENAKA
ncbi:tetratricopeptide repeat protein [Acaryochloris sp. 'Moss Beach']|uniref:tetratricopeptide repeat protein n=1 Tax=Acaryochloris sp. 'Moss Beach' TaxID=2740837 RepID=UPI001F26E197|nr:tetratricopeptide repeat protein [Acaryochloris sp. 'Moss Beach']UJB71392.1 tetratricopeptide repeat protein [Acaryochloris sp. 'Moss Beach']